MKQQEYSISPIKPEGGKIYDQYLQGSSSIEIGKELLEKARASFDQIMDNAHFSNLKRQLMMLLLAFSLPMASYAEDSMLTPPIPTAQAG